MNSFYPLHTNILGRNTNTLGYYRHTHCCRVFPFFVLFVTSSSERKDAEERRLMKCIFLISFRAFANFDERRVFFCLLIIIHPPPRTQMLLFLILFINCARLCWPFFLIFDVRFRKFSLSKHVFSPAQYIYNVVCFVKRTHIRTSSSIDRILLKRKRKT